MAFNIALMFAILHYGQYYTLPLAVNHLKLGVEDAGTLFDLFLAAPCVPVDAPACALVDVVLGALNVLEAAALDLAGTEAPALDLAGAALGALDLASMVH